MVGGKEKKMGRNDRRPRRVQMNKKERQAESERHERAEKYIWGL